MAEEVKETREDFEAQLEESLNKASTNEDAVWNRLEQMKEDGDVLALTVGGVVNGGVIVYVEGIRGFIPASLLFNKICRRSERMVTERCGSKDHHSRTRRTETCLICKSC